MNCELNEQQWFRKTAIVQKNSERDANRRLVNRVTSGKADFVNRGFLGSTDIMVGKIT